MRTIRVPALGRTVSLAAYLHAVRMAKANPDATFKTGLTTWWPTTGAEIMDQFREGMIERINEAMPYIHRGKSRYERRGVRQARLILSAGCVLRCVANSADMRSSSFACFSSSSLWS